MPLLRKSLLLAILLIAFSSGLCFGGQKLHIISIGDSWAEGWCDDMKTALLLNGHTTTIYNKGIPTTTSQIWSQPGALADVKLTLVQHPEIEWAVVSMGGNDLLDGYILWSYGEEIYTMVEGYIRSVLDELTTFRPEVHIFLNGYDFPNFEQSLFCIAMGQSMLGGNTYSQNQLIGRLSDMMVAIADDYPQVIALNLLGTLQAADGVRGAPNYYRPSPAHFFPEDDCIHPSDGGWLVFMDSVYDGFFASVLNGDDDDDDVTDDDDDVVDDDDDVVEDDDDDLSDDDDAAADDDTDAAPEIGDDDDDSGSDGCGC